MEEFSDFIRLIQQRRGVCIVQISGEKELIGGFGERGLGVMQARALSKYSDLASAHGEQNDCPNGSALGQLNLLLNGIVSGVAALTPKGLK